MSKKIIDEIRESDGESTSQSQAPIMVGSMLSIDPRPPLFPSGWLDAYLSLRTASELLW